MISNFKYKCNKSPLRRRARGTCYTFQIWPQIDPYLKGVTSPQTSWTLPKIYSSTPIFFKEYFWQSLLKLGHVCYVSYICVCKKCKLTPFNDPAHHHDKYCSCCWLMIDGGSVRLSGLDALVYASPWTLRFFWLIASKSWFSRQIIYGLQT